MTTHSLMTVMTLTGLDGKTAASTKIDTTSIGLRFVPMAIHIEPTTVTGLVSVSSLSIGTNSASYDNIVPITALTGLTSANIVLNLDPSLLSSSIATGTDIYVKITTVAVGTTYTLSISVLGFYF